MTKSKKILCLLLSLLMVVSCISVAASAVEKGEVERELTLSPTINKIIELIQNFLAWLKKLFTPPVIPFYPEQSIQVNQIYGLGAKNDDGQSGSHSFVELYNPTDKAVKLEGWSLQAAGAGSDWAMLPLTGSIPAKHSFLVVLTKITNTKNPILVLDPAKADMRWDNVEFPNKGLKVVLLQSTELLDVANPFDIDGAGTTCDGYADMIGVAGNDKGSVIDGCETAFGAIQSKQVAIRRSNYSDTDNNLLDCVGVDYRTADQGLYGPKNLAAGASEPIMVSDPSDPNGQFPKVFIQLNGDATLYGLNKEDYTGAQVTMTNAGENNISLRSAGVRLRGNSTAYQPKRPLRIKFDSAVSVMGRPAEKSWVLLANFFDFSMMRNYVAYDMYREFGTPGKTFPSMCEFVDVYVNGVYQGVYTLCDQIDTGEGRVNVSENAKKDGPDTGYLIEFDGRAPDEGVEGVDFFYTAEGLPIAIKTPDPDDGIDPEYVAFIKKYCDDSFAAIQSGDWAEIQSFIDIDTFIDFFMLAEIYQLTDIGGLSVYLNKDKGGKLRMGPMWDYDLSCGNAIHTPQEPTGTLWAESQNVFFRRLMRIPEFQLLYLTKYMESYETMKAFASNKINTTYNTYKLGLERNQLVWDFANIDHGFETPTIDAIKTYEGQVFFMRDWLDIRFDWLAEVYGPRLAALELDAAA